MKFQECKQLTDIRQKGSEGIVSHKSHPLVTPVDLGLRAEICSIDSPVYHCKSISDFTEVKFEVNIHFCIKRRKKLYISIP